MLPLQPGLVRQVLVYNQRTFVLAWRKKMDGINKEIESINKVLDTANTFAVNYGFQIVGAIIILVLGWYLARWFSRLTTRLCEHARLDVTLTKFFSGLAKTIVLIFVVIIALGKLGITITPLIAALSAVVFGGTLALQGLLSNFGAGLNIILSRPFVVGDTIRIQGITGVVEDIKLGYTLLSNEDGELITIPNNKIVGEIIFNSYSNIVVEAVIRISYNEDPQKAVRLVRSILEQHPEVAQRPAPLIGIQKFSETAYEIGLRYWVPTRRFFEIQYTVNGMINQQFAGEGIRFARPQMDVHISNNSA